MDAAPRFSSAAGFPRGPLPAQPVSFQRVLVPILRVLASRTFTDTCLQALATPAFATVAKPQLWEAISRCLAAGLAPGAAVADGAPAEDDVRWEARSWTDVLLPVAAVARHCAGLVREVPFDPAFQRLADALQPLAVAWQAAAPAAQAVWRQLEGDIASAEAAVAVVRHAAERKQLRAEREEEARRRGAILGSSAVAAPAAAAAAAAAADGPGELSAAGRPRHDNDFSDFRLISVGPTEDEVLSCADPYLPFNDASAPHHAQGADRLLDIHFRLLRHDLLSSLLRSCAALQECYGGKGGAPVLRGNKLIVSAGGHGGQHTGGVGAGGRNVRAAEAPADLYCFRNLGVVSMEAISSFQRGARISAAPDLAAPARPCTCRRQFSG